MCLESVRLFPKIAKEDIVVCKKLIYDRGKLVTFFMEYPVTSMIMKTKFTLFTIIKLLFKDRIHGRYIVEEGVIHSYDAILPNDDNAFNGRVLYVKAVIPKGALYYRDYWGYAYASNKLILKPSEEQLTYFENK